MKVLKTLCGIVVAVMVASLAATTPAAAATNQANWVKLFDGKTLNGWKLVDGVGPGYVLQFI